MSLSSSLFQRLEALETESEQQSHMTGHARWMVPYADLLTLLLGLFMVLFSLSNMDKKQLESYSARLQESLHQVKREQQEVLRKSKQTQATQAIIAKTNITQQEALKLERELSNKLTTKTANPETTKGTTSEQAIDGQVEVQQDERGIVISLSDNLFFAPGSAELNTTAKKKLDVIAKTLRDAHRPIRVEGHTDNTPIKTALFPSNWELSTARATNIIRYLVEQHHFLPKTLSAAGYGEFNPVADNSSIEGKRKNRRVDIVLLGSSSPFQEHSQ